ncbi:hypothetical protein K1X84_07635 [bacterium]|nr:hypothetical protein [bacterium]
MIDLWSSSWRKIGRYKGLVVLLWISTILFSLPVMIYLQTSFGRLDKTHVPNEWLQSFVFTYLTEFISDDPAFLGLLLVLIVLLVFMYALLNVFLTGGILGVVTKCSSVNDSMEWSFFWLSAKKFMARFFLLLMITGATSLASMLLLTLGFPGFVMILLLWCFLIMVSDMTKVKMASSDLGLARSYFDSFRWVSKNLFPLIGLYLLNIIPLLIIFLLWRWVDGLINANSTAKIVLIYCSHQVLMIIRALVRVQIYDLLAVFHKLKSNQPENVSVNGTTFQESA